MLKQTKINYAYSKWIMKTMLKLTKYKWIKSMQQQNDLSNVFVQYKCE